MQDNKFTVLFDFDSMIYKSVYKICSFTNIRGWFIQGKSKSWMEREIVVLTINRLSQMTTPIFQAMEDSDIEIIDVEYFMTACPRSVRKAASADYKIKRKKNKWVSLVRKELLRMEFAVVDPQWEADDLIKDRATELGVDHFIICSIDKDLKQIPGIHFDYFRPNKKDQNGQPILNEYGEREKEPFQGLSVVGIQEAESFFWKQMLMGDSGDGIKGIPRIGEKKSEKILNESENHFKTVYLKYMQHFGNEEGQRQFDLHILLLGLGINHRPQIKIDNGSEK